MLHVLSQREWGVTTGKGGGQVSSRMSELEGGGAAEDDERAGVCIEACTAAKPPILAFFVCALWHCCCAAARPLVRLKIALRGNGTWDLSLTARGTARRMGSEPHACMRKQAVLMQACRMRRAPVPTVCSSVKEAFHQKYKYLPS